jgi:hypothetical protein
MECKVDYLPDRKIVGVKFKGRLNFQVAEQFSKEAVKIGRHNECSKYLIDHTETKIQGGVKNIHATGEELQQFGFKSTDKVAIIIADPGNEPSLPESVNQNSRWSVLKYFYADKIQDAFDWLSGND